MALTGGLFGVVAGVALFAFHIWPYSGEASTVKRTQVSISNRTETLKAISIERESDGLYALALRNESSKIVTGFAYNVRSSGGEDGPARGHTRESNSIAPGAMALQVFGILPALEKRPWVLNILAVYFIDGSGEGDGRIVQEFRDTDAGYERLNQLVKPMIEELSVTNDGALPQAISELKLRIRSLPDPPEGTESLALLAGFRDRKEMAALELDDLGRVRQEGGADIARKKIDEISSRYERQRDYFRHLEFRR
jgi:hypothetical protein